MTSRSTDRLVDDVARSMTSAAGDVDLREAVIARIGRRSSWPTVWLAVPAAATAVVLFAVLGPPRPRAIPAPPALATAQATPPAVVNPNAPLAPPPVLPVRPRRPQPAPELLVRTIPALPGPAALETKQIQPNALAFPLLNVKPIATEPLAVNAIDDGSGRQPRF